MLVVAAINYNKALKLLNENKQRLNWYWNKFESIYIALQEINK